MVTGIAPDRIAEYKRLHAAAWPAVLARIAQSDIRNDTIFLREPQDLLCAVGDHPGDDIEADLAATAADPETRRWWTFRDPSQRPFESRAAGEHRAAMEEVCHVD